MRKAADASAANLLPVVRQGMTVGATTHRIIAKAVNANKMRAAGGGVWHNGQGGIFWPDWTPHKAAQEKPDQADAIQMGGLVSPVSHSESPDG